MTVSSATSALSADSSAVRQSHIHRPWRITLDRLWTDQGGISTVDELWKKYKCYGAFMGDEDRGPKSTTLAQPRQEEIEIVRLTLPECRAQAI